MRVLVVIAGASRFPHATALEPQREFARSAEFVADLFLQVGGLHLRRAELFWLFDNERNADDMDRRLATWLSERMVDDAFDEPPTDLIFYYVGHGHSKDGVLYLTLRSTREDNIEQSSWSTRALAKTMSDKAPGVRKHVILDCCFAAEALRSFQTQDPAGVSLLCAADRLNPASVGLGRLTAFSSAFIETLHAGFPSDDKRVGLDQVHERMREVLVDAGEPAPKLHDPAQPPNGPKASTVPILPNRRLAPPADPEIVQRELSRRLLELETRFEERTRQRIADADATLKKEFQKQIQQQVAVADAAVLKKANRAGRGRALVSIVLVLVLVGLASHFRLLVGLVLPAETVVVLDPALGWQRGVDVDRNSKVCVRADGRIHLGLNQVVNATNAAKFIIREFATNGTETKRIASEEPNEAYADLRFRRPWSGPEGSPSVKDKLLDDARLNLACPWGALMAAVLKEPVDLLSARDPLEVLQVGGISQLQVFCVGAQGTIPTPRDHAGTLVFIVNDAVNSRMRDTPTRSKELLAALEQAAVVLPKRSEDRQRLEKESLPLFWYSDNGGQYTVRVRKGPCK